MPGYDAIVIGAGPGGLATLASLLDAGTSSVIWIDRTFNGGRLNSLYREISSWVPPPRLHDAGDPYELTCRNTKAGIYLDAIHSSPTCTRIADAAPHPNAIDGLKAIDRDETCELSLAGDMVMLLTKGLLATAAVDNIFGEVEDARWSVSINAFDLMLMIQDSSWTVTIPGHDRVTAPRLFLCTGSHPTPSSFHTQYNPDLTPLDLDQCMVRSTLPSLFPSDRPSTIAVIGNSHSGILVCRNIYELSSSHTRDIRILNFRRRGIRFAEYRDDGIVFDNTGLKGATADWARDVMEKHPDEAILQQIELDDEDAVYRAHLPKCTHIVYAIGYTPSAYPRLYVDGRRIDQDVEFDMHTSGFRILGTEEVVKGLFGCGIAFPELVKDPEGHVEAAVGLAKFFKFAERVKGDWVAVR